MMEIILNHKYSLHNIRTDFFFFYPVSTIICDLHNMTIYLCLVHDILY